MRTKKGELGYRRKAKVSRITGEFSEVAEESSQSAVKTNKQAATSSSERLVPGMSQYGDSQDTFSDNHDVDMHIGTEDFEKAEQESATISQRCEFLVLSPS